MKYIIVIISVFILSCSDNAENSYFEFKFNNKTWSSTGEIKYLLFFDGYTTKVSPVVYGERPLSNYNIESYSLVLSFNSNKDLPDTTIFNTNVFPSFSLFYNVRHESEEIILHTGNPKALYGHAIVKNYNLDNLNRICKIKGTFTCTMSDSIKITSGKFNVSLQVESK
jgi:hypothetical protein